MGILKANSQKGSKTIVVLCLEFPWSLCTLTYRYNNIKVYVFQDSILSTLAMEYYKRFGVQILVSASFEEIERDCRKASLVVDEGWVFSDPDLMKMINIARAKPVIRLGSGYKRSARNQNGNSETWKMTHSSLGGVTDLVSTIVQWHSVTPGLRIFNPPMMVPPSDLRSVLKAGLEGTNCAKPWAMPDDPVQRVIFLRKNEVSCAGLFPLQDGDNLPTVRTRFGTSNWVSRELSHAELLSLKDIPEPLYLLIENKPDTALMTRRLFDSCRVPIKSLSAFFESILGKEEEKETQSTRIGITSTTPKLEPYSIDEQITQEKNEEELLLEELSCTSSLELTKLFEDRIIADRSENRSKRSDYELPSEIIWDVRVLPFCNIVDRVTRLRLNWRQSFDLLRAAMLRYWRRKIRESSEAFLRNQSRLPGQEADYDVIQDCLARTKAASTWGWDGGSRPHFWNWPPEWQTNMKNGFKMWLTSSDINWKEPQPKPSEKDRPLIIRKLFDIRSKGYVVRQPAKAYIRFFAVPKGDCDVRMVYDGTKSGLNDALWAPWFPLPTAGTHLRLVDQNSWMADNDAGECFHNWVMDRRVQELCGIDLTHYLSADEDAEMKKRGDSIWIETWSRCAMGLRPSPYLCVKGMLLGKEIILGDRRDPSNVFRWDHVCLNLPGMEVFDSTKPWVYKSRSKGVLSADLIGFVDDLRPIAPTEGECWEASQAVAKRMAWLGIQDASRKRNPPSKSPGPWAGIVVTTDADGVYVSVSEKKWEKAQLYIRELSAAAEKGTVLYKSLESKVGYLVYVAQAYPSMKPYLSALYGTLNSWRPDRDARGFKIAGKSKRQKLDLPMADGIEAEHDIEDSWLRRRVDREDDSEMEEVGPYSSEPPRNVQFVKGARECLSALVELTQSMKPPLRTVRGGKPISLVYGFGDASGTGFGSAIQLPDNSLFYRSGLWSGPISKESSSNYRELRNLVDFVHDAAGLGHLDGSQLMLFTDNTTAESAFHKGGSSSPILHDLVLKLRKLEMTLGAELTIIHVSGKRMIESGVDGISRGDMNAGVMAGQSVYSLIPLHKTAKERSCKLIPWIQTWAGESSEDLNPDRWPEVHATGGTYIWSPPPAAADAAVDWVGESIHKRPGSVHVIVIPRLMTSRWRKTLGKIGDLLVVVPCGIEVWPTEMLEPLVLVISLPLSNNRSETGGWRFKGARRVSDLETSLCSLWKSDFGSVGSALRKLLGDARRVRAM